MGLWEYADKYTCQYLRFVVRFCKKNLFLFTFPECHFACGTVTVTCQSVQSKPTAIVSRISIIYALGVYDKLGMVKSFVVWFIRENSSSIVWIILFYNTLGSPRQNRMPLTHTKLIWCDNIIHFFSIYTTPSLSISLSIYSFPINYWIVAIHQLLCATPFLHTCTKDMRLPWKKSTHSEVYTNLDNNKTC